MYKSILLIVVLALMIGSTVFAYGIVTGATRSDCPGKITCPLTGELVCKDECPLGEANETAPRVPDCCRNAK